MNSEMPSFVIKEQIVKSDQQAAKDSAISVPA